MRIVIPVGKRHTLSERNKLLAAYRRSRLTQKEFATQAGIGHSTLTLWLRKAGATRKADRKASGSAFVSMPNLFPASSPLPAYRVQFPRGVIVEVARGFQSAELGALLEVARTL